MKTTVRKWLLVSAVSLLAMVATLTPGQLRGQSPWPGGAPITPEGQRNALKGVQTQVKWLQNTTRTAPSFASGGVENVWRSFQEVRLAYGALKATLTPGQLNYGANELAELDAGLDIIEEVFGGYQADVAGGRPPAAALRGMCQVLNQTIGLWLQELNKNCARMRVGSP
jgi:hypothetical protein